MLVNEPALPWGGPWTDVKLDAFEYYVKAYLAIMNKYPYWDTIYFDGFAGSGERTDRKNPLMLSLEFSETDEQGYEGAAERVCRLHEPCRFDYYYFIEKDKQAIENLERKVFDLNEDKKGKIVFRAGDCNGELAKLADALKRTKSPTNNHPKYAALIFLDPFGMQVSWESIAQLTGTKSDIWILLPTAVIVNRLLDRKGELKSIKKLESFFGIGEEEIRKLFFVHTGQQSLFDLQKDHFSKVANPIEKIAAAYIARLKTIWTHVTERPLRLNNRSGAPLFHFVFASNNSAALNIANDIIKKI